MFGMDGLSTDIMKQAKQLRNPAESEALQLWADSLAQIEHDLQTTLRAHEQALGLEPVDPITVEERREEILAFAEAYLGRDIEAFYLENQTPDGLAAEKARPYLGMEADAWQDQRETWVSRYREQAGERFGEASDEEIVAAHVRRTFGVSLDVFEAAVIEWSAGGALQDAVLGEFELVESRIEQATGAVESGELES